MVTQEREEGVINWKMRERERSGENFFVGFLVESLKSLLIIILL